MSQPPKLAALGLFTFLVCELCLYHVTLKKVSSWEQTGLPVCFQYHFWKRSHQRCQLVVENESYLLEILMKLQIA